MTTLALTKDDINKLIRGHHVSFKTPNGGNIDLVLEEVFSFISLEYKLLQDCQAPT